MSGPQALLSLPAMLRRQLSLNVASDVSSILSADSASALSMSEHAVLGSTTAPTTALPFLGSTVFFTNPRLELNGLMANVEGLYQSEPLFMVELESNAVVTLVGPWALLWNLGRQNQYLNARHLGVVTHAVDTY